MMNARPKQGASFACSTIRPSDHAIFIEATNTAKYNSNTGIQRVVRNVIRSSGIIANNHHLNVEVVTWSGGLFQRRKPSDLISNIDLRHQTAAPNGKSRWLEGVTAGEFFGRCYRGFLRIICVFLPSKKARNFVRAREDTIGLTWCLQELAAYVMVPLRNLGFYLNLLPRLPASNSVLIMLDAAWWIDQWGRERFWAYIENFKKRGGRIISVVYDTIPISHPEYMPDATTQKFGPWLTKILLVSDGVICISAFTADCVNEYANAHIKPAPATPRPIVSHFHLGSELDLATHSEAASTEMQQVFLLSGHVFLVVGTIEPRKNHAYILDAFDRFWNAGGTATLLIVGRKGWKIDELLARIANHAKAGTELFHMRNASDADLEYAYKNASALIFASIIEGFGLPIVEAHQRGLPVICSDIPVFREIADEKATLVDLAHPESLEMAVVDFCRNHPLETRTLRSPQPQMTWEQSTEALFQETMKICNRPT